MNTLKLKLLAASMFAFAAAANAQTAPTPVAPVGLTPSPNNNTGTGGAPRDYYQMTNSTNDSYVGQSGSSQFAQVDQTAGNSLGNTADVYQIGGFNNNAFQTQSNNNTGISGRNQARVDQLGNNSTSNQTQDGSKQYAYTYQDASSNNNSAVQTQGANSSAGYEYIKQSNSSNYASQSQDGGNYNKAEITQSGIGGTADQQQLGTLNQASTMQTNASSFSQIQQNGDQNRAFVTQR